jgi:hypothetical protein
MAWLLVGSIPGVLLGSQMSIKVPERALRVAFGVILVLSGIKIVGMPQANLILEVGVAILGAVFLVWSGRQLFVRRIAAQQTP